MFSMLNISASGLTAQRKKLDAISSNIANANTTRTENGEPYRRKIAVMRAKNIPTFEEFLQQNTLHLRTTNPEHISLAGETMRILSNQSAVETKIEEDKTPFKKVYDPNHPDADADGFVRMPNVNVVSEMVEMINASRAYEANLSTIDAAKKMAREALDI